MPYLLNAFYLLAVAVASPWLLYKSFTTGKYRRGMLRKLRGDAVLRDGDSSCVWFHGVSVGEVHLLRPLVARFRQRHPDWDCVISTTTDTGYDEACKRFPDLCVFFWPLDFTWAVHCALRRVNPTLVVLAECELWPNFLAAAHDRGVPVLVGNGRMSPRSFRRWLGARLLPFVLRRMFHPVAHWCVQTPDYAERFRQLGVPAERLQVTGSIKYDGVEANRANPRTLELRRLFGMKDDDPVLVFGSTQDPEERLALAACRQLRKTFPRLLLLIVPRQKERFDEVAHSLERCGLPFVRRSRLEGPLPEPAPVILVDTIGELSAVWGLADVAFVGGSLDGRRGGQNMIEPAAYGAAVVFGPHVWNFRDTAERLLTANAAVQVQAASELEGTLHRLLGDAAERRRLGEAARELVQSQQGATERTLDEIDRVLAGPHPSVERAA